MKTKITQNIKAIILGLVLTVGMGYVAAQTFVGPTEAPPGGNTPAPLNIGISPQTKTGPLSLANLFVSNLYISTTTPYTPGQVLTTDVNGKVKWDTVTSITPVAGMVLKKEALADLYYESPQELTPAGYMWVKTIPCDIPAAATKMIAEAQFRSQDVSVSNPYVRSVRSIKGFTSCVIKTYIYVGSANVSRIEVIVDGTVITRTTDGNAGFPDLGDEINTDLNIKKYPEYTVFVRLTYWN